MKTLQLIAIAVTVALFSCSSDDGPAVAPVISFSEVNLETPFFTEGATEAPALTWNGDVGTVSMDNSIQGLSINATDGTVSWDKSLPLGINKFKVIATNSAGAKEVSVQIDNQFTGDFIGGYNVDPESEALTSDFELKFNADGTMNVMDASESIASGTWTLTGTTFTSVYTYNTSGTYSLIMDIIHSDTEAHIEGYWYEGDDPVTGSERGFIKLNL